MSKNPKLNRMLRSLLTATAFMGTFFLIFIFASPSIDSLARVIALLTFVGVVGSYYLNEFEPTPDLKKAICYFPGDSVLLVTTNRVNLKKLLDKKFVVLRSEQSGVWTKLEELPDKEYFLEIKEIELVQRGKEYDKVQLEIFKKYRSKK